MKKILLAVCTIAALAHSYCEIRTRQTIYWNGGHQEAVYKFSNGQSFVLTCRDGYNSWDKPAEKALNRMYKNVCELLLKRNLSPTCKELAELVILA